MEGSLQAFGRRGLSGTQKVACGDLRPGLVMAISKGGVEGLGGAALTELTCGCNLSATLFCFVLPRLIRRTVLGESVRLTPLRGCNGDEMKG
jgi:hypothetical protein